MLEVHPDDSPFFLWVSYVHPHHPFNPPKPYDTMYDPADMPPPVWHPGEVELWPDAYRRKYFAHGDGHEAVGLNTFTDEDWARIKAYYYGMVSQIDKNIGRILDRLEKSGVLENTIIVFTSDHGENLGDHHLLFKGTTYDCVTNVPFILATPDRKGAGESRDLLCSTIDLTPTLLDLAGVPTPDPNPIQGQSLAGTLESPDLRLRDALLIENGGVRRSVRAETALLTWHGQGLRGELYDLQNDPDCLVNLWDDPAASELQSELLDTLIALMAANVDPLPPRVGVW
jgi:arylsulfatase A-like enzyme